MLIVAMLALLNIGAPTLPDSLVDLRQFQVGDHPCTISVTSTSLARNEPNEILTVRCDGSQLLSHNLGDAAIHNVDVFNDGTMNTVRIVIDWERGTGAGITALTVKQDQLAVNAEIAFDHFSKTGGEAFENGEIIFANVGHRFVGTNILPRATNLYRWDEGKYQFVGSFVWNNNASWSDRYCILASPNRCPAERSSKPIRNQE